MIISNLGKSVIYVCLHRDYDNREDELLGVLRPKETKNFEGWYLEVIRLRTKKPKMKGLVSIFYEL